jgi:GTP-binding protein
METGYITSAAKADQLPHWPQNEICFVGRSNAGKSTLLNAVTEHKGLARTSSTPGRTQMVNLFYMRQGERQLILADLPGYGYTASGGANSKHWVNLVETYLGRPQIQHCFFLMDIRREMDPIDLDILLRLYQRLGHQLTVALTKADKLNQQERAKAVKAIQMRLHQVAPGTKADTLDIIPVSSLKKIGIPYLQTKIKEHLPQ